MKRLGDGPAIVLAGGIAVALIAIVGLVIESLGCKSEWSDSGMAARYQIIGGCQIEVKPGVWIPAKNYRGWQ